MSSPLPAAPEEELHGGTLQVMALLLELLTHGGWLGTTELARRAGAHRDTARRILVTLAARHWVRRDGDGDASLWTIGPELPRIGLLYQDLLHQRALAVRADLDRALAPLAAPPVRGS